MELTFFIAARFGPVTKTALIYHTHGLAAAKPCLHSVTAFSCSPSVPPASRLGVGKSLGGDTAGAADPNWPKGRSLPHDIMLSNKK